MKQRFHVVDLLLQNGASPNETNAIGWNCLTSAVQFFHEDSAIMLLLLLQTGAKTDHKDNNGMMPIDHAVKRKKISNSSMLEFLIDFHQNTNKCLSINHRCH